MRLRLTIVMVLLATFASVHGANIFSITGSPISYGRLSNTLQVVAFTTSSTWSNVTVTMPLVDNSQGGPIGGTEGTVYLMNQIGPGTTTANQVAPPVTISGLTSNYTTQVLWTGITLVPGTYYVEVISAQTKSAPPIAYLSLSAASIPLASETITAAPGVVDGGNALTNTIAAYPPASDAGILFIPSQIGLTVTGDNTPGAAPVPPSLVLVLPALVGLGIYYHGRRRLKPA